MNSNECTEKSGSVNISETTTLILIENNEGENAELYDNPCILSYPDFAAVDDVDLPLSHLSNESIRDGLIYVDEKGEKLMLKDFRMMDNVVVKTLKTPVRSGPYPALLSDNACYSDSDSDDTLDSVPPRVQFFVDDSSDKEDPPPPRRKKHFMEMQRKDIIYVHNIFSSGKSVGID